MPIWVLNKSHILAAMLLLAVFIPQLPPVFARSEMHINLIGFVVSCGVLAFWGNKFNIIRFYIALFYYSFFQGLLLLAYLFGPEGFGGLTDLPSLFRPLMLLVMCAAFSVLLEGQRSIQMLYRVFTYITVISFGYAVLEVFFFSLVSPIIHIFYRLPDKNNIDGVSVSFFTLPYYAAYVHSILLLFMLSRYSKEKSVTAVILVLMSLINIILTQSKTGIFVAIATLFIFWFMRASRAGRIWVFILTVVTFITSVYFLYDFIKYLNDSIGGNFAYTTMVMLESPDEAGNLAERSNQVARTFELLMANNPLLGVGLGKGETIESWLAYIPYRYGGLGLMLFVFFYIALTLRCFILFFSVGNKETKELLMIVCIWSFCLFFTQLSSLSIEISKAAYFSALMIAIASKLVISTGRELTNVV
ncbi:O-antigen ligase family protein [Marinagarivorans algicola]|uniref:O-antigen ligase family protein n=1 Tax=Marinagarivorans algicola TaxID=1513270 RepID=UPI0037369F1A